MLYTIVTVKNAFYRNGGRDKPLPVDHPYSLLPIVIPEDGIRDYIFVSENPLKLEMVPNYFRSSDKIVPLMEAMSFPENSGTKIAR